MANKTRQTMEEPSLKQHRPTHDGRMEYWDVWRYVLEKTKLALIEGRFRDAWRGMNSWYNHVYSYIDQSHCEKIEELLDKIDEKISNNHTQRLRSTAHQTAYYKNNREIERSLFNVERLIHLASRDMQLPVTTESDKAFSIEEFMRKSDL